MGPAGLTWLHLMNSSDLNHLMLYNIFLPSVLRYDCDCLGSELISYDVNWSNMIVCEIIWMNFIPFIWYHFISWEVITSCFDFPEGFFDVIESRQIIRSGIDLIRSDLRWFHLITCDLKCSHKIQLDLIWFNLNESIIFSCDPFWSNFTQVWGCHHRLTEVELGQMVN